MPKYHATIFPESWLLWFPRRCQDDPGVPCRPRHPWWVGFGDAKPYQRTCLWHVLNVPSCCFFLGKGFFVLDNFPHVLQIIVRFICNIHRNIYIYRYISADPSALPEGEAQGKREALTALPACQLGPVRAPPHLWPARACSHGSVHRPCPRMLVLRCMSTYAASSFSFVAYRPCPPTMMLLP